jgi:RNA polymerase sigma factor (sigma-70 family)
MHDQSLSSFGVSPSGVGLTALHASAFGRLLDDDDDDLARSAPNDVVVVAGVGIALKPRQSGRRQTRPASVDPLRALMDSVKTGDPAAFRDLHRACAPRVHAFVQRIVKRHELADEIESNVFMQVWRDAAQFDSERGCTFAWISTIARSRSLDMLRQQATRQRHEEQLDESDAEVAADPNAGPHELLLSVRLRKVLGAALARLTPAQRHVLRLTFFEGLSHEEVAATSSLPLGTVKSHVRRGLAALRANSAIASMGF